MIRFATAQTLFDEFPSIAQATDLEPNDDEPVAYIRSVADAGKLREAVAVCAFLLAKREAVWWCCQCLRSKPELVAKSDEALLSAEAWAREPGEEARQLANRSAQAADQMLPSAWAAHAAGYSSGNLSGSPDVHVRTPPHLTAECVRIALVLAECKFDVDVSREFLRTCLASAMETLERG